MTYKRCNRCVLDTSVSTISFDEKGVCNYCSRYDDITSTTIKVPLAERKVHFDKLIQTIKAVGANEKYDCLIGVSGGMDSSYIAYLAMESKLRPLLVHFDNGWNSNQATTNIENIVKNTGFDLYTYVIDWNQFKDLQKAYFRSSVVDIEVPTDQLIFAALYEIAKKFKIKSILSGENLFTETIMPTDWALGPKLDYTNLKTIHKQFGERRLKNFPKLSAAKQLSFYREGYRKYSLITYTDFVYARVIETLQTKLGWKNFEDKHFESIFTRFYQGYILPKKFNVDKRLVHYSNLINSGFIAREEVLRILEKPTYSLHQQEEDLAYILKKWDMSKAEFDAVMAKPAVSHDVFGYDKITLWDKLGDWWYFFYRYKIAYPLGIIKRPKN